MHKPVMLGIFCLLCFFTQISYSVSTRRPSNTPTSKPTYYPTASPTLVSTSMQPTIKITLPQPTFHPTPNLVCVDGKKLCTSKDKNLTTIGMIYTLVICLVMLFLLVVFFEYNRHYKQIFLKRYQKRFINIGIVPPQPPDHSFGWLYATWNVSEADVLHMVGLDAYMCLRYHVICIKLGIFVSVLGILILLPVYSTVPNSLTQWDKYTVLNVVGGDIKYKGRLWLTSLFAYIFGAYFCQLLYTEYDRFSTLRLSFLTKSDEIKDKDELNDPDVMPQKDYSIMLEYIPAHLRSEEKLFEYFDELFPGEVFTIEVALDLRELDALIEKRIQVRNQLERAIAYFIATKHRKRVRDSLSYDILLLDVGEKNQQIYQKNQLLKQNLFNREMEAFHQYNMNSGIAADAYNDTQLKRMMKSIFRQIQYNLAIIQNELIGTDKVDALDLYIARLDEFNTKTKKIQENYMNMSKRADIDLQKRIKNKYDTRAAVVLEKLGYGLKKDARIGAILDIFTDKDENERGSSNNTYSHSKNITSSAMAKASMKSKPNFSSSSSSSSLATLNNNNNNNEDMGIINDNSGSGSGASGSSHVYRSVEVETDAKGYTTFKDQQPSTSSSSSLLGVSQQQQREDEDDELESPTTPSSSSLPTTTAYHHHISFPESVLSFFNRNKSTSFQNNSTNNINNTAYVSTNEASAEMSNAVEASKVKILKHAKLGRKEAWEQAKIAGTGALRGAVEAERALEMVLFGAYYKYSSTAFVTFKSRIAEAIAHSMVLDHDRMEIHHAPSTNDIIWNNLAIPKSQINYRNFITNIALVIGSIFWSSLVTVLNAFASTTQLTKNQQSLVSVMVLLGLLLILPFFFDALARYYERMKLESEIQDSIFSRYFYYQLVNIYVTVCLQDITIHGLFFQFLKTPQLFFTLLGQTVPAVSLYFCSLVIVKVCIAVPLEMCRPFPLSTVLLMSNCMDKHKFTRRELRSGAFYSWPMLYGWIYPQLVIVQMIMIIYATIAPLLMPFCVIFFLFCYQMYKYQLLFVYVNDSQSGGYMWYAVFNRSLIGLILALIVLLSFFALDSNSDAAQGPFMFLFPLPFGICYFWHHCDVLFKKKMDLSFRLAKQRDYRNAIKKEAKQEIPLDSFQYHFYRQPALTEPFQFPEEYRKTSDDDDNDDDVTTLNPILASNKGSNNSSSSNNDTNEDNYTKTALLMEQKERKRRARMEAKVIDVYRVEDEVEDSYDTLEKYFNEFVIQLESTHTNELEQHQRRKSSAYRNNILNRSSNIDDDIDNDDDDDDPLR